MEKNKTSYEKAGQVFSTTVWLMTLGKVKEPPFQTSVTLCELKKYKLLFPLQL